MNSEEAFNIPGVKFIALDKHLTLRVDRITDIRILNRATDKFSVHVYTGSKLSDGNVLFVGSEKDAIAFLEDLNKRLGAV